VVGRANYKNMPMMQKTGQYRFAAMILLFDCDQFILRAIENCAPFAEKVYISYSPLPWSAYNHSAREEHQNPSKPAILEKSNFRTKIELVTGVWDTDEAQRTEVLNRARQAGFDYLIIQDADEFYTTEDYEENIITIEKHPNYTNYQTPWIKFWKTTKHVLEAREDLGGRNTIYGLCGNFAINLKKRDDLCLTFARMTNHMEDSLILPGLCFHLSWVMSDEQVRRKINTWSHSHQVRKEYWWRYKWLGWREGSVNLNPVGMPGLFTRAVRYIGPLPKEIRNFPSPEQTSPKLSWRERLWEKINDIVAGLDYIIHEMVWALKRAVR